MYLAPLSKHGLPALALEPTEEADAPTGPGSESGGVGSKGDPPLLGICRKEKKKQETMQF